MKWAVLSDLHVLPQDPLGAKFQSLVEHLIQKEDVTDLWLLGDILDFMVGPYSFWSLIYPETFAAVQKALKAGVRVHWALGNHDFDVDQIPELKGVHFFDQELEQTISTPQGPKKILLAHGDLVDQNNKAYLKWRAWTRSQALKRLLRWIPNAVAYKIVPAVGRSLSAKSRKRQRDDVNVIQNRYRDYARQKFNEGYDGVFLGHCHVDDDFRQNEHFYMNLGSGLDGALRYALWNPLNEAFPISRLYSKM